jgi:hypothetical protein
MYPVLAIHERFPLVSDQGVAPTAPPPLPATVPPSLADA